MKTHGARETRQFENITGIKNSVSKHAIYVFIDINVQCLVTWIKWRYCPLNTHNVEILPESIPDGMDPPPVSRAELTSEMSLSSIVPVEFKQN